MPATNTLDFSSAGAADKALKQVSQLMIRAGQPVIGTEFVDKPKRSSNITYRQAHLTLASGQMVTLNVTTTGDIYQVLLNNKVIPIRAHDDVPKAVVEIAGMAEKNQAAFQKAQARVKVEIPPGMTTPRKKIVDALTERSAQLDTYLAERRATVADLEQQLGAMTDAMPQPAMPDNTSAAQAQQAPPNVPDSRVWDGFQIVDQAFVDAAAPAELATGHQVRDKVSIYLAEGDEVNMLDAIVLVATKSDYTLAVAIQDAEGEPQYAVLNNIDTLSVAARGEAMLDSGQRPAFVTDLSAHQEPAMRLAGAYVAAREIIQADPAMMDSVGTAGAIEQLQNALDVVENNAPINEAAGNMDQAKLERRLAASFRMAIAMLDSTGGELTDAGLAELVNIAKASAAEDGDIKDQDALAQLLALGLTETAEGLYMVTSSGRSALDDAGYDIYGEPYAASQD